jgi:hypothetical protein
VSGAGRPRFEVRLSVDVMGGRVRTSCAPRRRARCCRSTLRLCPISKSGLPTLSTLMSATWPSSPTETNRVGAELGEPTVSCAMLGNTRRVRVSRAWRCGAASAC